MPTAASKLQRDHEIWLDEVDRCIRISVDPEACAARAPAVSGWSVAEQLEHLLLADRSILTRIGEISTSAPGTEQGGGPKLLGHVVLLTGFIPRGRGKAPASTRPKGRPAHELEDGFAEVRASIDRLGDQLTSLDVLGGTSPHPILGRFTIRQWVRFSGVHHRHHAKIVRDILAASA